MAEHIHVPDEWKQVSPESLKGTIMVIGRSDSGKTTFACYLFEELCRYHERVGFLDCDMGQSTLGLPTTMTLALSTPGDDTLARPRGKILPLGLSPSGLNPSGESLGAKPLRRASVSEATFPPRGEVVSYFVGSTSPRGNMLPTVIGAYKLQRKAQELGAEAIVVDTTGLVDRAAGGGALKQWKVELLEPSALIGIERGAELEHILWPWRWDKRVRVFELPVCKSVTEKARVDRIAYRESQFRSYFEHAHMLMVPIGAVVVFEIEKMTGSRLLALQNQQGFALALGVAKAYDRDTRTLAVITPLPSLEGVSSIRFGSLNLDPATGQEIR